MAHHHLGYPRGFQPLPVIKDESIRVTGWRPLRKNSWITFMDVIQGDDLVIFGSALSDNSGVHVYTQRQNKCLSLSKLNGNVWNGQLIADGRLVLAKDDGYVTASKLHAVGADVKLIAHENFQMPLNAFGRIDQISWVPETENHILTKHDSQVLLWSLADGKTSRGPVQTIVEGPRVKTTQWSPHNSFLLGCATIDKNEIALYDIRYDGKAYSRPMIAGPGQIIRWNPFLPYCVAVASPSTIEILDLRYQGSQPQVSLPAAHVNDFCWSNSNCELLLTSSSGRNVSLWSALAGLNGKDPIVGSVPLQQNGGDVVQVKPSTTTANSFIGTTLLGSLVNITVDRGLLRSSAPVRTSKGGAKDSNLEAIERSLYCRDFDATFEGLLNSSHEATMSNFESWQSVANRTIPAVPIAPDSWRLESLAPEDCTFLGDLARCAIGIPPSFSLSISEQPASLERIRFKVRVLEALHDKNSQLLFKLQDTIMSAMMDKDEEFLDTATLIKITRVLLAKNRLAGMQFGRKILQAKAASLLHVDADVDGETCALIHLVCFPTIFDAESLSLLPNSRSASPSRTVGPGDRKNILVGDSANGEGVAAPPGLQPNRRGPQFVSSKSLAPPNERQMSELQSCLRSVRGALSLIDLEIKIEQAEDWEEKQRVAVTEMALIEQPVISSRLVCMALESLLDQSQLDSYFLLLGKCSRLPRTEFNVALLEHMDKQVLPKLKYTLAQAIDTQRPSLVVRAIHLIVIIVDGIRPLCEGLEPFLLDRLKRLMRALRGEDFTSMGGFANLIEYLNLVSFPAEYSDEDSAASQGIWRQLAHLKEQVSAA